VKDTVSAVMRAVETTDRKCESSVVHITGLGDWHVPQIHVELRWACRSRQLSFQSGTPASSDFAVTWMGKRASSSVALLLTGKGKLALLLWWKCHHC